MKNESSYSDPMPSSGSFSVPKNTQNDLNESYIGDYKLIASYINSAEILFKDGKLKAAISVLKEGIDKTRSDYLEKILTELLIFQRKNESEQFSDVENIKNNYLNSPFTTLRNHFEIKDNVIRKYIGSDSFVIIPGGAEEIHNKAFCRKESIRLAIVNDNIIKIGDNAFSDCPKLVFVKVYGQAVSFGKNIFEGCYSLTECNLPDDITEITEKMFYFCVNLRDINLSDTLTTIDKNAFGYCINLKNIEFPETVKIISDFSFVGCRNLTVLSFPPAAEVIGDYAFQGCTALISITIYDNIKHIGAGAFLGCDNLRHVFFKGTKEQWKQIDIDETAFLRTDILHFTQ